MTTTKKTEWITLREGDPTAEPVAFLVRVPTSRDQLNVRHRVRMAGGRYITQEELDQIAKDGIRAIYEESEDPAEADRIIGLIDRSSDLLRQVREAPKDDEQEILDELAEIEAEAGSTIREAHRILELHYEPYQARIADRERWLSLFQEALIRELVIEIKGLTDKPIKAGLVDGLSLADHDRIPAELRAELEVKLLAMLRPSEEQAKNSSSPSSTE